MQTVNEKTDTDTIAKKLDLEEYLERFTSFMSRPKPPALEGDTGLHLKYIKSIGKKEFPPPPEIGNTSDIFARLEKQSILKLDEIFIFVKIIKYFKSLKTVEFPEPAGSWLSSIEIPEEMTDLVDFFTEEGDLNPEKEPELHNILVSLHSNRTSIKDTLQKLAYSSALRDYMVDTQLHLFNEEETLLVRGGFSSAIKASVVGRSSGGFFYILPDNIRSLKEKEAQLLSRREEIIRNYCRTFSSIMGKWKRFLLFLDREFDRFDHYQSRVRFAKIKDYEIVLPKSHNKIILDGFCHPALEDPVPVSIEFKKSIMLITGVNAGGKTMLLKSILSAIFMAKYLLPFKCNIHKTEIGRFRDIEAIIDDPQSVKNDISTFAGRMIEFSRLFRRKNTIVGVDEIELGTDADEAASLFRVILEELRQRGIKIVATTHHKRLASIMAGNEDVELVAALYNEKLRSPTYTFLQGSIGKSYAFETALRYGIPESIVAKARKVYGEDKERLNELIERSTMLESRMRKRISEVELKLEQIRKKELGLEEEKLKLKEEQRKVLATLENRYNAATKRALEALKRTESAEARRLLNEAHKYKSSAEIKKRGKEELPPMSIGDKVSYRGHRGEILSLHGEKALISTNGMKIRVKVEDLSPAVQTIRKSAKKDKVSINVEKSGRSPLSLKILGLRADEAIEEVDAFLSNALVHGMDEVEIIHGTGSGILARAVSEHLQRHPKVKSFYKMPGNSGITVVEL